MFLPIVFVGLFFLILMLFVLVILFYPGKRCPSCGHRLPKFRNSQNEREIIFGGWTCPKCGSEIDTLGNILVAAEEKTANSMNTSINESRIIQIMKNLEKMTSDELLEIWLSNNRRDWTEESYEAIRRILVERGEKIPAHHSST